MLIWVLFAVLSVASIAGIVAAYHLGHARGVNHARRRERVSVEEHARHEFGHARKALEALTENIGGSGTLETAIRNLALAHLRLSRIEEVAGQVSPELLPQFRRLQSRFNKLRRELIKQGHWLEKWDDPRELATLDPEPDWEPE